MELRKIIFTLAARLHPCPIILQVISDMYLSLLTGKAGKYIYGTVLPQQPCPPDTLFQLTFNGIQLHLPQYLILIGGNQKTVPFVLCPAQRRSLIPILIYIRPKVTGYELIVFLYPVRRPYDRKVMSLQPVKPCAVTEMDSGGIKVFHPVCLKFLKCNDVQFWFSRHLFCNRKDLLFF